MARSKRGREWQLGVEGSDRPHVAGSRGTTTERHGSSFSRLDSVRVVGTRPPSDERGRRAGRVSTDTHGSRATKRARGITTGQPVIRPSLHNGFMSRSPWGPGFFAPIAARIVSAQPSASVSAPGPHDFAVRKDAARRTPDALGTLHPPHPASHVVTIAIRPSCRSEQAHSTSDLQN
jgi:hypothetical protein